MLTNSGAFTGYGQAGIMCASPFTEAKYLVSMQDFVYENPNMRVLTADNINVRISISVLVKIIEDSDYILSLCTNVAQMNELLDANLMERVRAMARTVKAREAYNLRGEQHALGMKEFLNQNLNNKGILIKRVIITSVILDKEIADNMQETTIYQFKSTLERKRFAYE